MCQVEGPGLFSSLLILSSMEVPGTHLSAQRPQEKTEGPDLTVERTEFWFQYAVKQKVPSKSAGDSHRFCPALLSREGGSCLKKSLYSKFDFILLLLEQL